MLQYFPFKTAVRKLAANLSAILPNFKKCSSWIFTMSGYCKEHVCSSTGGLAGTDEHFIKHVTSGLQKSCGDHNNYTFLLPVDVIEDVRGRKRKPKVRYLSIYSLSQYFYIIIIFCLQSMCTHQCETEISQAM